MSESENIRHSKVPRRAHVTLTQDSEVTGDSDSFVVVGHRVRKDVAQKSGLLSGLAQVDGLASLPDDLSPEDVHLWQAARLRGIFPSTDELVTIVKVADALGGDDQAAWVDMVGQRVVEAEWTSEEHADAMQASLLALPPHLLHRCLVACVPLWVSLGDALELLPQPLHQALVASFAADGTLEIPATQEVTVLALLSATVVPHPGLLELSLGEQEKGINHCCTVGQAALLARTIAAHASLSKVDLLNFTFGPLPLKRFAACLPRGALPQLADLSITVTEHPASSAALMDCLKGLSSLSQLHIVAIKDQAAHSIADAPVLSSCLRSAVMPVHLPRLETININAEAEAAREEADGDNVTGAPFDRSAFILSLLPFISAPMLTLLKFATNVRRIAFSHFRAALAHLPSLCELHIDGEMRNCTSRLPLHSRADSVLPVLFSVRLASMCPLSLPHLVTFSAQLAPNVTKLVVTNNITHEFSKRASVEQVKFACASMLQSLGQCKGLQHLMLGMLCGAHTGEGVLCHSTDLAAALKPLTALTYLHLVARPGLAASSGFCSLHGQPLGVALTAHTALQTLRICSGYSGGGVLELQEPQHVLEACTGLAKLSRLDLCFYTLREVQLPDLILKLPALRQLNIGKDFERHVDSFDALCKSFPSVSFELCTCSE